MADCLPEEETEFTLFTVGSKRNNPIIATLQVNGCPIDMEVDTGAAVSLVSTSIQKKYFPTKVIEAGDITLTTYTGEQIPVVGKIPVNVSYKEQNKHLYLYVVERDGPCLMGRDWLTEITLDWKRIGLLTSTVSSNVALNQLLDKYSEVFKEGSGPMNTFEANLYLKPNCQPKFVKARPVPFAIKPAVDCELDRLEQEGIIEKVTHSEWASPVVAVPKPGGHLRLCGDYKVTLNSALKVDQYPLPKPEDLFASLAGGQKFTKIDLAHAYQQMSLKENCRQLVVINTHRGLYQYTWLPFGVASSPAIFQKVMDTILQGIQNVFCYLDDILITGPTEEIHLANLEEVLQRLQRYGIRAKRAKCVFMQPAVEYLGHKVDAQGLHTTDKKVEAVLKAPQPKNVTELHSFLGLLHYYHKSLPNLSSELKPLNRLLKSDVNWKWTQECSEAFIKAKKLIGSAPVLAHYDPKLPLKLAGDASAYGIGAVLSHVFPDGGERPVAFASRTLSTSERNYSQIEKEALSLIFGINKFHQYLYGRHFTLVTDHKPLTTLLGPSRSVPPLAAARLQRWALLLSAYSYDIQFKRTYEHSNADGLSRLPLPVQPANLTEASFTIGQIQALPVTAACLVKATRQDPILSQVMRYMQQGWPTQTPDEYKPYHNRCQELSIEGHCLLWGNRVVVPEKLRAHITEELHRNHPGITRMKSLARSYLWWPGLDKALEDCVHRCLPCQSVQNVPAVAPLHPWLWPARPWQHVHLDFAGPFLGHMFMIMVDAHSKWPEIVEMSSTTTKQTIAVLNKVFAVYGLPEQVVSDNGPQFISDEFQLFMKSNGIKHIRCSPYHPSSNGLAERMVQTFKKSNEG